MSLPEQPIHIQAKLPCWKQGQGQMMIDGLPDEVLLEIFHFCKLQAVIGKPAYLSMGSWNRSWVALIQVCRRWRYVIFGAPRRLNLQVLYTPMTPTRMKPDIWPRFPISIYSNSFDLEVDERDLEHLIAAFEHRDRTSQIYIQIINIPALERLIGAMHEPLPALTDFHLAATYEPVPVLPETFLGGFAPRLLRAFSLYGIPFPTFPKFILSATNITYLALYDIPDFGYISPEVMTTCLAALPKLDHLILGYRFPPYRPLQVGLPPLTRAVLPALASLSFEGTSVYFEDFLARTHIPLLKSLEMRFFIDPIFDIPRVHQFIDRTERLRSLGHAWVLFGWNRIAIRLGLPTQIELTIFSKKRNRQLSSLAHICDQHLPLSGVEQLAVCELYRGTSFHWKDDVDSSKWLELFHPFIAVRNLYVAKQFVPFVTAALRGLTGERTMEVLPVLNNLFLEGLEPSGPVQEAMKPFVSARQLSNHPIVICSEPPPQTSRIASRVCDGCAQLVL